MKLTKMIAQQIRNGLKHNVKQATSSSN